MFNNVSDDVPSEQRTNQTVVSLLNRFRPPVPNDLLRTLLVLKCSALVFLEPAERSTLISIRQTDVDRLMIRTQSKG